MVHKLVCEGTFEEKIDSMINFKEELAENGFIRIHQSYLVNQKYIENVKRYKVVLTNGVELSIPKVRYTYVKEQFILYQGEV